MQLHQIDETDRPISLPRLNQEFIGLGHQLQLHKREKKQIKLQHQAIENRVLFLEKQQQKARKNLLKKKKKFQELLNIRQRQQQDDQQKIRLQKQKMNELQRLKMQSLAIRMIHKNNYESNLSQLKQRNHSDYSRIRQQRIDGEYRKKQNKHYDSQQKKDNWLSLNISKQKGKQKIDQFYKSRNRQHIKQYQSRIMLQNQQKQSRINEIKNLQLRQKNLRTKIQNVSMKNSKMQQLIKNVSQTISPLDLSSINAQLYGTKSSRASKVKKSYQTLNYSQIQKSLTRANSNDNDGIYQHPRSSSQNHYLKDEVQQNIELGELEKQRPGFKVLYKRRKNKHANRYKQYQAY